MFRYVQSKKTLNTRSLQEKRQYKKIRQNDHRSMALNNRESKSTRIINDEKNAIFSNRDICMLRYIHIQDDKKNA